MAIHIDTDGNFYFGATGTTEFDDLTYTPVFSVTKDGVIRATSGQIGGWELASNYLRSENSSGQYIYLNNDGTIAGNFVSGTSGWKISADGDAFFNSIDIRVKPSSSSEGNAPSDGTQSITIGSAEIYESNNNLYLNSNSSGNKIIISSGDKFVLSGASADPNLTFDGAGTQDIEFNASYVSDSSTSDGRSYSSDPLEEIYELTISNQNVDIYRVNAQNNDVYFYGDVEVDGHIEVNSLKVYDGFGSSGEVLTRTTNGLEWAAAGGAHADSDHTSFLTQNAADTRYVNEDDHTHSNLIGDTAFNNHTNNSGAHGSFDNYSYWRPKINGSNISGTIGSTNTLNFVAGTNMTISEAGSGGTKNITFSSSGGGATTTSSSLDTSSGSAAGYFARHMSISGNTLTYYRSAKGSSLYVLEPRPTSNNSSSVGISTIQYNEVHARYGYFDFLTGANTSSRNVKTDISDLDIGLNFINTLQPVKYKYVPQLKQDDGKYGWGFIAEDVETTLSNIGESNSKFYEEGRTDYETYGRCAHELICTCDDPECCPEPITEIDTETGEVTETGCMKDNSCMQPCCTDIAGSTIDGKNYVHTSEEDCEEVFIDGRKHSGLKKEELVAPLVKAVQELSTQISDLTARVEALEG